MLRSTLAAGASLIAVPVAGALTAGPASASGSAPSVSSISPSSGSSSGGTTVTINGTNFGTSVWGVDESNGGPQGANYEPQQQIPSITAVNGGNPLPAAGGSITITGANLSGTSPADTVYFGTATATATGGSTFPAGSITVNAPAETSAGSVQVRVNSTSSGTYCPSATCNTASVMVPYTHTDSVTYSGSGNVYNDASAKAGDLGGTVTGTNVPANTTVTAVTAGTSVTLSNVSSPPTNITSITITGGVPQTGSEVSSDTIPYPSLTASSGELFVGFAADSQTPLACSLSSGTNCTVSGANNSGFNFNVDNNTQEFVYKTSTSSGPQAPTDMAEPVAQTAAVDALFTASSGGISAVGTPQYSPTYGPSTAVNNATFPVNTSQIGDLLVLVAHSKDPSDVVNSVTGGGVGTWTPVIRESATSGDTTDNELWAGVVTSPGSSQPISFNWSTPDSGCPTGSDPGCVDFVAQEFNATNANNLVTGVKFGGTPASSFSVNSPTQITATAPAGSGTQDVTVTNGSGTSSTGAADQFTYTAAPPPAPANPRESSTSVIQQSNGAGPSIFVRTTNGALLNFWYIPSLGKWGEATVESGGVVSDPVVVPQPDGSPSVFFEKAGGALFNDWYVASQGIWGSATVVAGGLTGTPVATLQSNGSPSVFAQGANHSLLNFFYVPGPGIWGSGTVAGPGTVFSNPAEISQIDGTPSVFFVGPGNSLMNDWYVASQGIWGTATVAGPGNAFSDPGLIAQSNDAPSVFVVGPGNSLRNYWYIPAGGLWGAAAVSGPGTAFSTPGVLAQNNGAPSVFVVGAGNSLANYWYIPAGGQWGAGTVAGGGSASTAPAVTTQTDGSPSIFVVSPGGALFNYWYVAAQGIWGSATVAPGGIA